MRKSKNKINKFPFLRLVALGIILFNVSCNKIDFKGEDPYAGALPPLDVKIDRSFISPKEGEPGTIVTVKGEGFQKYLDSGLSIAFNGIKGEIVENEEGILKIKVPENASSGLVSITIKNQVFPGPLFRVRGDLEVDEGFKAIPGANGSINAIQFIPGGKYLIGGSFTDYDNSGLSDGIFGIARLNENGSRDETFEIGKGVQGTVYTIDIQADGKYLLGGNISNYQERFKSGFVSNILRLNSDGSIDSTIVVSQRSTPTLTITDTVPALNAYFDGRVSKIFSYFDAAEMKEKLLVVGSFNFYMSKDFTVPSEDGLKDSVVVDSIRMENIARLNLDGSLDSSFNYNWDRNESLEGPNGTINDAVLLDDGRLLIVGSFSRVHSRPASRVAILKADGMLDENFNVGTGPDAQVYSVVVLKSGKYLISGQFNNVDGNESRKLAVLNRDGSLDHSFNVGEGPTAGPNGIVFKSIVLANNKILVTGAFDQFSSIKRDGTVVLNEDGSINHQYNNLGAMLSSGTVNDYLNIPNKNETLLVGGFRELDLIKLNRIAKLKY